MIAQRINFRIISSVVLFSFLASAAKADVLIQSSDISPESYAAYLQSESTFISLADYLSNARPSSADSDSLTKKFERAQSLFLASSEDEAKHAFIEITKTTAAADWKDAQREVILYSFLRAAQLSGEPKEKDRLLHEAARFTLDMAPDLKLFPPPLLEQFKSVRDGERKQVMTFAINEKFPGYDIIIVDGRRYEAAEQSKIAFTSGIHRITALSNSRLPMTNLMTASQLAVFKTDAKNIVLGSCDEPALTGLQELSLTTASVIYPNDCVRTYTGTSWIKGGASGALAVQEPTKIEAGAFAPSLKDEEFKQEKISRKTWLMIGAGAVIAASAFLIVRNQRSRGDDVQPVQRQGF